MPFPRLQGAVAFPQTVAVVLCNFSAGALKLQSHAIARPVPYALAQGDSEGPNAYVFR